MILWRTIWLGEFTQAQRAALKNFGSCWRNSGSASRALLPPQKIRKFGGNLRNLFPLNVGNILLVSLILSLVLLKVLEFRKKGRVGSVGVSYTTKVKGENHARSASQ